MKRILITLLYIIVAVSPLAAQIDTLTEEVATPAEQHTPLEELSVGELWSKANNAYINNKFGRSVKLYSEIESRGLHSLPLFYNLGNGYFKQGKIAKSLLYYHRALKLDPSDADTQHNIEVAESQTKDNIEKIPQFILVEWNEAIANTFSIMGWSIISILAWGILLVSVVVFFLTKHLHRRKSSFYGALISGVVMFISTSYAISERNEVVNNREAIVMSSSLAAKSSPTSTSKDLFILHAGTKVGVISSLEGWSEIVIADGRQGWVEDKLLEEI